MHTSVVQIAERAAAGDYPGALAELALLDRDVTSAVDERQHRRDPRGGDPRGDGPGARRPRGGGCRIDARHRRPIRRPCPPTTTSTTAATRPGNDDNKGKGNNNGNDDKGKNKDD